MLELHRLLAEYRAQAAEDSTASTQKHRARAVPVLDEAAFRLGRYSDGSLLKFRGVVRDVQDPELVLLAPEADVEREVATAHLDAGMAVSQKLVERVPLKVALFPHSTEWARRAYDAAASVAKPGQAASASSADASSAKGTKRSSEAVEDTDMESSDTVSEAEKDETHAKKPRAAVPSTTGASSTETSADNSSSFLSQAVNVYVYDGQYKDTPLDAFKVNEAFEFVGILDLMVVGSGAKTDSGEGKNAASLSAKQLEELQISDCIEDAKQKERSGVVLHCCDVSGLQNVHHVRPHRADAFYDQVHASNTARTQFCLQEWASLGQELNVQAMRQQLVDYLTQTLGGDALAAEYLLLSLLAHVYSRADPSTPLGNLSLNVALDKSLAEEDAHAFVTRLQSVLEALMPMVARVDLSLKQLNATKFMPHKDYDRELLLDGVLQVANGTAMLVNETALAAGQLNEQGVKNLSALQSLVEKMLLPYDFQFYSMDFPQDVAVVTVSQGKSLLPVNVSVPLVAHPDEQETAMAPSEDLLECFRVFLSVLRSFAVTIGNEEAEMAEQHYVECRKSKQKVQLEDLHRWLRLARLMALSRGEDQVSADTWQKMLGLESQRLARGAASSDSSASASA